MDTDTDDFYADRAREEMDAFHASPPEMPAHVREGLKLTEKYILGLKGSILEEKVIGTVIVQPELFDAVSFLIPDDFFNHFRERYWIAIQKLNEEGGTLSPESVAAYAARNVSSGQTYDDQLKLMKQELRNMTFEPLFNLKHSPYAFTIITAARQLVELRQRREVVKELGTMLESFYDENHSRPLAETVEIVEQKFQDIIGKSRTRKETQSVGDAAKEKIAKLEEMRLSDKKFIGVSTGFEALDQAMAGMREGDLVVIGGRPSMGKTALGLTIATNAALLKKNEQEGGATTLFFSLEMGASQLVTRLLSRFTKIHHHRIHGVTYKEPEAERIKEEGQEMQTLPLYIDDNGSTTVAAIRRSVRKAKQKSQINMVIIDYVQLVEEHGEKNRSQNRVAEITHITKTLKIMAKEEEVVVLLLSQLSRATGTRESQRPVLTDMRDSGSIEQDADVVVALYRPEYYLQNQKPEQKNQSEEVFERKMQSWESQMQQLKGVAEVIVLKNRQGAVGTFNIRFDPLKAMFYEENDPDFEEYMSDQTF